MADTARKRRRWPWVILVVGLLLAGGSLAWRLRPLNATESALVGRWKRLDYRHVCILEPTRRYTLKREGLVDVTGDWRASTSLISFTRDPRYLPMENWTSRLRTFLGKLSPPEPQELRRDGADRFWISGSEFVRFPD